MQTKHLTPLEFLNKHFALEVDTLDHNAWLMIMTKYHDYALEQAAEMARVEVREESGYDKGNVTMYEVLETEINGIEYSISVDKSIFNNLKINKG